MSYQVLARKWRPHDFSHVVGQRHVVQALTNALDADRLHHAYLFSGTRGVGKTTLARVLAKCLNCESGVSSTPCGECSACRELDEGRFVDLIEVDAASRAKVDETRELMENVQFAPARGRFKVYLIDEVHMFSTHSFNALLKTLEEPPPHVKFLLATTDPQRLPVTVLSRCLQFNLKRVSVEDIVGRIETILADESLTYDADAVTSLARAADGSLRDALSLLDQAIAYSDNRLQTESVRQMLGTLGLDRALDLLDALAASDASALMAIVAELAEQVVDFMAVLKSLASDLQAVAMVQLVPGYEHPDPQVGGRLQALAAALAPEDVQLCYQIALMGLRDLPLAPDPRGGFEMVLLRMLAFKPAGAEDAAPVAPTGGSQTERPSPASPPSPPVAPADVGRSQPSSVEPALDAGRWPQIVATLDIAGLTRELAANSVLTRCDGSLVELKLCPTHAHLQTETVTKQLEQALQSHRGAPTRLRVVLDAPVAETPAQQAEKLANERKAAAINAIENDLHVKSLQESFEAVVDHNSVEPRDG